MSKSPEYRKTAHAGVFLRVALGLDRSIEVDCDRKIITRVWDARGNLLTDRLTRADLEVLVMQHRNRIYLELTQLP